MACALAQALQNRNAVNEDKVFQFTKREYEAVCPPRRSTVAKKDVTSVRSTIEWLKQEGELVSIKEEIDRDLEVVGVIKALDNGPALLFENIKDYPGVRTIANIFAREDRVARMFGVDDWRKLKFKVLEGIRHPIPPKIVDEAPCQEVVITKDFDVPSMLPITKGEGSFGVQARL